MRAPVSPIRVFFAVLIASVVIVSAGSAARAASTEWVGDAHAAVRLITGEDRVGAGRTIEAGLEFRFAPGWHGYWRTPGDAGLPPMVDWSGSGNVAHGDIAWPAPIRLVVQGLQNTVYEGHVVLPVSLFLDQPGAATKVHAAVGYAACSNVCVPYQADLELPLAAGPGTTSPEAPLIATARGKVPGTPEAAGIDVVSTRVENAGTTSQLVVELRSRTEPFGRPDLLVEGAGSGLPGPPNVDLWDGGRAVRLTVRLPSAPSGQPLTLTFEDGARTANFEPRIEGGSPASAASDTEAWVLASLSALIGGLILNLMPCVLPVLSIKLLGLVRQAGVGRRAMRLSLMATAMGVMASFLALALGLVGLKASGASLGWGIQFQQPWFLAAMASLTVLFAASLFDWVSIGLPSSVMTAVGARSRGPLIEAFLTGAFATLLATPCSAPFVGTAVGFALARGPGEILGIFLCLGTGMAVPYWAAAAFPGLVRWIPRPGPWMIVLRTVLGALLLGTAGWLLLVLWSTAGGFIAGGVMLLLAALLALRGFTAHGSGVDRRWIGTVTAALALGPVAVSALPAAAPVGSTQAASWQAFDPDALPGLLSQGKTVLVDVTATWCLTCKVNELAALSRPEVDARLDRADVVRMRADWSRADPTIAGYLHRFTRYGIPLDVVYGPRRPAGEPLPELLTPRILLDALDRASVANDTVSTATP